MISYAPLAERSFTKMILCSLKSTVMVAVALGPPGADVVHLTLALGSRVVNFHLSLLKRTHAHTNQAPHAHHNTIASRHQRSSISRQLVACRNPSFPGSEPAARCGGIKWRGVFLPSEAFVSLAIHDALRDRIGSWRDSWLDCGEWNTQADMFFSFLMGNINRRRFRPEAPHPCWRFPPACCIRLSFS